MTHSNSFTNHNSYASYRTPERWREAFCSLARRPLAPADCDCGHPHRLIGGRHCCQYYGSFKCSQCHNPWTSAYTWKGEKQACRNCNVEMMPWKTDQLECRLSMSTISGAHDCARYAMCRKLGYDCSLRV